MEQRMIFFKRLFLYTQERFPLIAMILYSGAIFYLGYLFAGTFTGNFSFDILKSVIGALTFFFLLFQLRILDEHKDYQKDLKAHPDRMLSKGLITLGDLRKVFFPMIALQLGLNIYVGFEQLVFWSIAFVWTLLMFKEFFMAEFLNAHQGLYLISHQLLVPIALLYVFSYQLTLLIMPGIVWFYLVLFLIAVMSLTISNEIARKTWSADREHEFADSYTKFWGIKKAVFFAQLSGFIGGGILVVFFQKLNLNITFTVLIVLFYLLFLLTELKFMKDPSKKNSKAVEGMGVLFVFGCLVVSIIGFAVAVS